MKLTKDHLIEGIIVKKGTEVRVKEMGLLMPNEMRKTLGDTRYNDFLTQLEDNGMRASDISASMLMKFYNNFKIQGDIYINEIN